MDYIVHYEPNVPNIGGLDGPDRKPPSPPRTATPVAPDDVALDSDDDFNDPLTASASRRSSLSSRSRSGGRRSSRSTPPRSPTRPRPSSLSSRGGVVKRRIAEWGPVRENKCKGSRTS